MSADASQSVSRDRIASAAGAPATMKGGPASRPQRPRRVRASRDARQVHGDAPSQAMAIAPAGIAQESGTIACVEEEVAQRHHASHEQTSCTLPSDSAAEKHIVVICDAA